MSQPQDISHSDPPSPPSGIAPAPVEPAVVAAQAIRFCNRCGAAWQPEWDHCRLCIERATRQSQATALSVSDERRSLATAMALYGSMLGVSIIATLVAIAAGDDLGFHGLAAQEVAFGLIVLGFAVVCHRQLLLLLRHTGAARWLLAGPLLGIATFIVATSAIGAMMRLLNLPNLEYLSTFTDSGHGFGAAVLMIAVYPAVVEEVAFRGVILASLQRVISNTEAIFVSGAMFAILHLSVPSFFHLFVMGVVLAWLRLRSKALLPCMLLHFTHNFLVLLAERQGGLLPW